MSKDAFWFQHDSNAHADPKILELVESHGWAGYGAYWAIIESLRECDGYMLPSRSIGGLCFRLRIDKPVIETMIDIGLLVESEDMIFSESLLRRMTAWDSKKEKCRAAASLGGVAKAKRIESERIANAVANAKQTHSECSTDALPIREEKRRVEEMREETQQRARARSTNVDDDFEAFWKSYPKKVGKKDALKAFQKARKSGLPGISVLVCAIEQQRKSDQWRRDSGQYIPNPSTWLNQGRWDDVLPEGPGRKLLPQELAQREIQEWLEDEESKNGTEDDCFLFAGRGRIVSGEVVTDEADELSVVQDAERRG